MIYKLFRGSEVGVMIQKEIEKLFHVSELVMIESSALAFAPAPYTKLEATPCMLVCVCVCVQSGGDALYARGLIS